MCPSCGSSSPGCLGPAAVLRLGQRELSDSFRIPALVGRTIRRFSPQGALSRPGQKRSRPLDGQGRSGYAGFRLAREGHPGFGPPGEGKLFHSANNVMKEATVGPDKQVPPGVFSFS